MTAENLDRFVTIAEAAPLLHVSRATAYRMAARGEFPVPVVIVASRQVVSLRRLVEFINGEAAA